jgi:hypothetical protein
MLAVAKKTRSIRRDLFEDIAVTPQTRVARDKCIIYGIKILGNESPNRHGLDVDGTIYTTQAMEGAVARYLGKKVNINHPPRSHPGMERDANDRSGKFINVYLHEGQLYGDLKLLPSHPMTGRIMDAAEDPDLHDCFAMSHNAVGRGEVQSVGGLRKYVVTEIPEVRSVDIVADGGTNRSLFESEEKADAFATHLVTVLETAPTWIRNRCVELLGPNASAKRRQALIYQRQLQEVLQCAKGKKLTKLQSMLETGTAEGAKKAAETRAREHGIHNPNSSGQGHFPGHTDNPHHATITGAGYKYSHSTPITMQSGEVKIHHTYAHPEHKDQVVGVMGTKWNAKKLGSGREMSGTHSDTLSKHLKGRLGRLGKSKEQSK